MHARIMRRFGNSRLARMSSGQVCLIRDLGLVKGGKGMRHHEVVLQLSWRGLFRFVKERAFAATEQTVAGPTQMPADAINAGYAPDSR
jgi:hypothetical protein